eukprot:g6515.t1
MLSGNNTTMGTVVRTALGFVLWKALIKRSRHRGRNAALLGGGRPLEIIEHNNPIELETRGVAQIVEGVESLFESVNPDWQALPELIQSMIVKDLKQDINGDENLSNLRLSCSTFRRVVNRSFTQFNGRRFLKAGGSLNEISKFSSISSLKLNLRGRNLSGFIAALEGLELLNELSLEGVREGADLCEYLKQRTQLKKLEFKRSILPDLSFISGIESLTSLALVDTRISTTLVFESWNDMRNLEDLTIDKSDAIANANMRFLASITNLKSLQLGLRDFDRENLLTLVHLEAKLSISIRQMRNADKLSAIKFLPTLQRLSLICCDLKTLPFPLKRLGHLEELDIMTNCLFIHDFVNLLGVREQLRSLEVELMNAEMTMVRALCRAGFRLMKLKLNTHYFEPEDCLTDCESIEALHVSATKEVATNIFHCLGYLPNLTDLSLTQSLTSTVGIENLHLSCPSLKRLTIGACPMSNHDLEHISRVALLEGLNLLSCFKLTSISPLKDLKFLKSLKIENCEGIEKNLATILNESFLKRLANLEFVLNDPSRATEYDYLFEDLKNRSSCLMMEIKDNFGAQLIT